MIKNSIISGLLIALLLQFDGWAYEGFSKAIYCLILFVAFWLICREIDKLERRIERWLRR